MGQEEVVEQTPELTEEQLDEVEQKFLSGELKEGEVEEPKEEEDKGLPESDSTEEEDPEPKEEGPAIQENKRLRQQKREMGDELAQLRQQLNEPKGDSEG